MKTVFGVSEMTAFGSVGFFYPYYGGHSRNYSTRLVQCKKELLLQRTSSERRLWSVVRYASESWTLNKKEEKRIYAIVHIPPVSPLSRSQLPQLDYEFKMNSCGMV